MPQELDPAERAAIIHWGMYGAKSEPPTKRITQDDFERPAAYPIEKPQTAPWDQLIPHSEIPRLLLGFKDADMDDKWFVYTDGPDAQGKGTVHMYRSWTGFKIIEAKFVVGMEEGGELRRGDARFVEITWETANGIEEKDAIEQAMGVCSWCLDVKLP